MVPNETFFRALHLASSLNIPIFPLAEETKIPPRGHHGYKEATTDNLIISDWFHRDPVTDHKPHPFYNIGIDLKSSGLLVVDLDRPYKDGNGKAKHSHDGIKAFKEYVKNNDLDFPENTYCETTPGGGLHVFLKLPEMSVEVNQITDFLPGVDLIADFVPVAPSTITGIGSYKPTYDLTMDHDIKQAPHWLIERLRNNDKVVKRPIGKWYRRRSTYAGKLLDELLAGANEGNRNDWLTSMTGKLYSTGAEPETVYELLRYANKQCDIPLPETEVNAIFSSVSKYILKEVHTIK